MMILVHDCFILKGECKGSVFSLSSPPIKLNETMLLLEEAKF